VLEVFVTLLLTFAFLVPIPIGGMCIILLLAFSFAVVDGVEDFDNPLYLFKMKLGELNKIVLSSFSCKK
jgi:hypothetical protein